MRPRRLAAIGFTLLLSCVATAQQAPRGGAPQLRSAQPTSAQTGASSQPRPRTPREDEELRADLLAARKQYAEAVDIYAKLVKQEPQNSILLNKLGIAYHQQTLLDQAKRYYERAAKADRNFASAWNNLGTVYYQRRSYRKAVQYYKKALAIREDMPAVHSNLGYAYFAQKKYDEAMQEFHRAMELDPEVFERAQSTGSLVQDRTVSDHAMFYFFLAKSFARLGNAQRCAAYLKKARDEGYKGLASAKTDPAFVGVLNDPDVRELLGLPPLVAPPKSSEY